MVKLPRRNKKDEQQSPARITNDTVAEHRKRVLAGGRKFKYPVQYARHKLVINTVIISVVALILLLVIGWAVLYPGQNTSEFMYRVTRIAPVPVATVDGQSVRYSSYLMKFRSSEHYLREKEQANLAGEDGERQIQYLKQQAMSQAVADAYASKLAAENSVSVSDEQLEEFLQGQRQLPDGDVSERAYESVVQDYYGWSIDEYREAMRAQLLRQEVAYVVDDAARNSADEIEQALLDDEDADLQELAEEYASSNSNVSYGASGMVNVNNQDGGLTSEAAKLEEGQVSGATRTTGGDGYYFIRLLERNNTDVSYEYIRVSLSVFNEQLQSLYGSSRVEYYIDVPKPDEEITTE